MSRHERETMSRGEKRLFDEMVEGLKLAHGGRMILHVCYMWTPDLYENVEKRVQVVTSLSGERFAYVAVTSPGAAIPDQLLATPPQWAVQVLVNTHETTDAVQAQIEKTKLPGERFYHLGGKLLTYSETLEMVGMAVNNLSSLMGVQFS